MSLILPCEDPYLRAMATQRPATNTHPSQYLHATVETAMTALLESEISFHLSIEQLKKELECCFDFSVRRLFKAIDEQRYNYLTESSIRMFLRRMGHQVRKPELVAIIRRFDLDGDSRISF